MPNTAIPGTSTDPLADPFDLWNGKMVPTSPLMTGDTPVDGPPVTPQVGNPPPKLDSPPPIPTEPVDPYAMPPGLSGVRYTGTVGDAGSANPSLPLGDPSQSPPQVGGGPAVLGDPSMPNPKIGGSLPLGDPTQKPPAQGQNPDLDRVLLTYLLSHGGI